MMKKLFLFAIGIVILAFACNEPANAQDRTVTKLMSIGETYYLYNGVAADTLTANQDSIDFVLAYRGHDYVQKIAVKIKYDLRSTADTAVNLGLSGAEFSDHTTYTTIIAAADGNDINANNTVDVITSDPYTVEAAYTFGADSITAAHNHTPFDKSYRYYRLRLIYTGASGGGTGVSIDDIEFKFYTD